MNPGDLVQFTYNPFFTALVLELEWDDFLMRRKAKILWDSGRIEENVWCSDLKVINETG